MTGFVEELRRADDVDVVEIHDDVEDRGVCLIDFCAAWCDVCQVTWTLSEALAERYGRDLTLRHVDVDDHPELAARYRVLSVPTLLLLKDGEVVERFAGGTARARICAAVERAM